MSFNLFILFMLFFVSACGVKSDPIPPKDSAYPSYDTKFQKPRATPTPAPTNE